MATVKRIQSGSGSMAGGSTGEGYQYDTITLGTAVSAQTVCELMVTYRCDDGTDDPSDNNINISFNGASTSQIRISRDQANTPSGNLNFEWQLIEYSSGVTVQHGISTSTNQTDNITVTAVTLAQSWSRVTWYQVGSSFGNDDYFRSKLTSTTNLELRVMGGPSGPSKAWQVVDYDNCTVDSVSGNVGTAATESDEAIGAVDTTKTIVKVEYTGVNGPSGFDEMPNVLLSSTTNVKIIRGATGVQQDYHAYAIEFSDDVTVQRGTEAFGTGDTNLTETISAVGTGSSIIDGGGAITGSWHRNNASDKDHGDMAFAMSIDDATTIRMRRDATGQTANVEWQVLDFNGSGELKWLGVTSTDAEVATNWQYDTAPGATDTAVFDSDATDACQLTAGVSWGAISMGATFDEAFDQNGQKITVAGAASFDSDSTAITLDAEIEMSGDADITFNTGPSGYTVASLYLDLDGTGSIINASGGALTIAQIDCAATSKTTTFSTDDMITGKLVFGDGTVAQSGARTITVNVTSDGDYANGGATITLGDLIINGNGAVTASIPVTTMTGDLTLKNGSASTVTFNQAGALNATNINIFKASTGTFNYNTANNNVTAGALIVGNDNATADAVFTLGSETIDVDSYDSTAKNTGTTTIDLSTTTWTVSGDFDVGSNQTFSNAATVTAFTLDGSTACTLTSAGETLPGILVNKSANGVTLTDPLTAISLEVDDGDFDFNGQAVSLAGSFLWDSGDTLTADAALTITATATIRADGETLARLIITGSPTITWTDSDTITITAYTNTDWDGATFVSSAPSTAYTITNPASMEVSGMTVTDSTATEDIDAYTASNTDGGGNTKWIFTSPTPAGCSECSAINLGYIFGLD